MILKNDLSVNLKKNEENNRKSFLIFHFLSSSENKNYLIAFHNGCNNFSLEKRSLWRNI